MSCESPANPVVRRRWLRIAIVVSLAVHAVAGIALLVIRPWEAPADESPQQAAASGSDSGSPATPQPLSVTDDPASATPERISATLEQSISAAEMLTEDQRRAQLAKLAGQLDRVSSEQSIDELSVKFRETFGTQQRAEPSPTAPPPGPFDHATAQMLDVTRETGPDGKTIYRSVVADKDGRTMEVELTAEEGESVHRTMQIVKSSPLAAKLYRQIALPLFDKLAREAEAKSQQAAPSKTPPPRSPRPRPIAPPSEPPPPPEPSSIEPTPADPATRPNE